MMHGTINIKNNFVFFEVSYKHFTPARSVSLYKDGLVSHQKSREEVTHPTHSHQWMLVLSATWLVKGQKMWLIHSSIASVRCMFIGCGIISFRSRESVVGIATRYGLDVPRFESWQEQMIFFLQKLSPSLLFNGYRGSFPYVKRPGIWSWPLAVI